MPKTMSIHFNYSLVSLNQINELKIKYNDIAHVFFNRATPEEMELMFLELDNEIMEDCMRILGDAFIMVTF
jgi:hypothetical protein